ncbi:MAG: hypothetical protein HQL43_06450 [Alphaproteobacteria bacterium]|nr:hypothetical protein [Alphaproteobacteria bacterium]
MHLPFFTLLLFLLLGLGGGASAEQGIRYLSPDMVADALVSPAPPLVVDARGRDIYASGTVPGAVNAGRDPEGFLPAKGSGALLLILRKGASPTLKRAWAERFSAFGYTVAILNGGFEAWQAAGLPVEIPASGHIKPGSTPFTIPRGLCEANTPAQVHE